PAAGVVSGAAVDRVVPGRAADRVVAATAVDGVVAVAADDRVVVAGAVQDGRAGLPRRVQPGVAGRPAVAQAADGMGGTGVEERQTDHEAEGGGGHRGSPRPVLR